MIPSHQKWNYSGRELEELAQSVLDHGRMMMHFYPQQPVAVEVDELAFRLRESSRTITKVLHLLEIRRQAIRTELKGLWTLTIEPQILPDRSDETTDLVEPDTCSHRKFPPSRQP